jgi:hypothetical protein
MTTYQRRVKELCDSMYGKDLQQITIDLIQDAIEPLLDIEAMVTRDCVGASAYDVSILLEVFNPKFGLDIMLLSKLDKALDEWSNDIEQTNIILGLPKES